MLNECIVNGCIFNEHVENNGTVDTENVKHREMFPCLERIDKLTQRTRKLCILKRKKYSKRKVGIVIFGFPPNAGAAGTAAYLNVFESLFNTLWALADRGYSVDPPASVAELRELILSGNAEVYGQDANVADFVSADHIVNHTSWLNEIESQWGPAPGKVQSDGKAVFILGKKFIY